MVGSWASIKDLYGYRCAYCLRKDVKLTRDHIYPKSKGGVTHPDNIVPACEQCNQYKSSRPIWEMLDRMYK